MSRGNMVSVVSQSILLLGIIILMPVAKEFNPDMVIVSAGFDAAVCDPLGGCCMSPYGYSVLLKKLMDLAQGKVFLALEGGYNLQSLANSAHACVQVLLEEKPIIGLSEAYPFESTWRVIDNVRQKLSLYLPSLSDVLPKKLTSQKASASQAIATIAAVTSSTTPVISRDALQTPSGDLFEQDPMITPIPIRPQMVEVPREICEVFRRGPILPTTGLSSNSPITSDNAARALLLNAISQYDAPGQFIESPTAHFRYNLAEIVRFGFLCAEMLDHHLAKERQIHEVGDEIKAKQRVEAAESVMAAEERAKRAEERNKSNAVSARKAEEKARVAEERAQNAEESLKEYKARFEEEMESSAQFAATVHRLQEELEQRNNQYEKNVQELQQANGMKLKAESDRENALQKLEEVNSKLLEMEQQLKQSEYLITELRGQLEVSRSEHAAVIAAFEMYFYDCWLECFRCVKHNYPKVDWELADDSQRSGVGRRAIEGEVLPNSIKWFFSKYHA